MESINRINNINLTEGALQWKPSNALLKIAHKVAIYSIFPIMILAMFEGVIKCLFISNLAYFGNSLIQRVKRK